MALHLSELFSTYSIVARDPETGQLGAAVQTHQMCVGAVVMWTLPGVGAIATQSMSNISFGPMGLAMLRENVPAPRVIEALAASDEMARRRQVAVVDAQGRVGAWTGSGCIAEAGHHIGDGYSVQANMMTNPTVVAAMANAYESADGDLAARMLAALQAAQGEDGDIRGMQSAALVVVPGDRNAPEWLKIYNLRVDEHPNPVAELARLVRLWGAQVTNRMGDMALDEGRRDDALKAWALSREQAPELEELAFWQAVTLADKLSDIETAAAILRPVLDKDPRRDHWLELIRRLQACGIIERQGAGDELLSQL